MKLLADGIKFNFVALLVNLTDTWRKALWRTGISHVVLTRSLTFSDHDVEYCMVLPCPDVTVMLS